MDVDVRKCSVCGSSLFRDTGRHPIHVTLRDWNCYKSTQANLQQLRRELDRDYYYCLVCINASIEKGRNDIAEGRFVSENEMLAELLECSVEEAQQRWQEYRSKLTEEERTPVGVTLKLIDQTLKEIDSGQSKV